MDKNFIVEIQKKSNRTDAESFVYHTLEDILCIKKNFVRIGFRLREAVMSHYVEELGYKNISDLAEDFFGIKKSLCYDLIYIAEHFCNNMMLSDKYNKFNQSQLIELSHVPTCLQQFIYPEMSVQDIRDYKNLFKSSSVYKGFHYSQPFEALEEYRKNKFSGHPEKQKQNNHINSISKDQLVCFVSTFALLLANNKDFVYYKDSNNFYHMAEEIFKLLRDNNIQLHEDVPCVSTCNDEFIYEFYSCTDNLSGIYRCYNAKDKDFAKKQRLKKNQSFELKTFKLIKSEVF